MSDKFNRFSFCRGDYCASKHLDFDEADEDMMYADIAAFIRIAIRNGYMLKIWDDGFTVCVDYNYCDTSLSDVSLEWVGDNEYIGSYDDEYADTDNMRVNSYTDAAEVV